MTDKKKSKLEIADGLIKSLFIYMPAIGLVLITIFLGIQILSVNRLHPEAQNMMRLLFPLSILTAFTILAGYSFIKRRKWSLWFFWVLCVLNIIALIKTLLVPGSGAGFSQLAYKHAPYISQATSIVDVISMLFQLIKNILFFHL